MIMASIILDFELVLDRNGISGIPISRKNDRPKALPLKVNKGNSRGRLVEPIKILNI